MKDQSLGRYHWTGQGVVMVEVCGFLGGAPDSLMMKEDGEVNPE